MTTHSSVLAWRIPRTEGPGGLQSMRSQRVGHDWATNTDWSVSPGTDSVLSGSGHSVVSDTRVWRQNRILKCKTGAPGDILCSCHSQWNDSFAVMTGDPLTCLPGKQLTWMGSLQTPSDSGVGLRHRTRTPGWWSPRRGGGRSMPGWAGKPISACWLGHEAGAGKAVSYPDMVAPSWICGSQTQATLQPDKDGGFPLLPVGILPSLVWARPKKAIDL